MQLQCCMFKTCAEVKPVARRLQDFTSKFWSQDLFLDEKKVRLSADQPGRHAQCVLPLGDVIHIVEGHSQPGQRAFPLDRIAM